MEPKAIKQEREIGKEESTNEEQPSSLPQNLTNHDQRTSRGKGIRIESSSRPAVDNSTVSTNGNNSINNTSNSHGTDPNRTPHTYSPMQTPKQQYSTNGSFSPHSTVNGTPTPSPPALSFPINNVLHPHSSTHEVSMNGGVILNGSCGIGVSSNVRQLTKVRRFLTTLQQFASDINSDVGERVRTLILSLLSGSISVEEFHSALQEVTHFPLRPFVLPFLRSHLPLLTRDLHSLARRSGTTVSQYIALQESNLLDAAAGEATDFFSSEVTNSKRKLESYLENGESSTSSCASGVSANSSGGIMNRGISTRSSASPPPKRASIFSPPYPTMGLSPELTLTTRDCRSTTAAQDDEWKNIHVMLTCILSMVEKTRRALTILQQREERDTSSGGRCSSTFGDLRNRSDYDAEVRRHASELVAHAISSTEDRVAEVKRKAEEAVLEVRKAAIVEVQRAVANAEARAQEMVNAERLRIENLMREVSRREAAGEHKVEPHQACWNCGRKAQDTCSGCNVAKYCSPFCQHKDWDHHHKVCSPSLATNSTTGLLANKNNCKIHKTSSDITKAE